MGSLTTEEGRPVDNATKLHILMEDPIGNDDEIIRLLQRNTDVNAQNAFNQTALMLGIAHELNDTEIIQAIFNKKTDFSLTDKLGKSLLHYFCFHGVKTCISIPLEECGILAKSNNGEVALHHVYDVDILKKLLESYAKQDLLSPEKWPYPSTKSELKANLEDFSKNPSQLLHKKGVIQLLCDPSSGYPIPNDISDVIVFALKRCKESPEMFEVLKCILEFGVEAIDAVHIREAIQLDNVELFQQVVNNCRAIESIVSSSDVLLKCLQKAKKNGDKFYSTLRGHLDDSEKLTDKKLTDNLGNNVVHVMCKFGKLDQLQDLLTEKQIAATLFSSVNNENRFPLALLKEPKGEFLEIFKSYFITPPKGFEKITLATPTSDLLHFAIEKNRSHKLANSLLKADFPVKNDGNGLSPLHKAVRYLKYNADLQAEILLRQSESEDISYINHKDDFGFSALDYAILYEKKDYFQFFRNRNAFYDQLQAEKMVQYLVFEKERSAEKIDYILEDLGITYPDNKNEAYVREIKTALKKAEETKSYTDMAAATQAKKTTILNILIVHSETIPFNPQLGSKHSDDNTIVLCHSLPLESFSLDHLHHFKRLLNKRLFFVGDKDESVLSELLRKLLEVDKTAFATNMDEVPAQLFHRGGLEVESNLSSPSPELLNKDQEISEVELEHTVELEAHRGVSGYFFVSDKSTHYSKSFYNISSETTGIGEQEALAEFGLLDAYFTETGETAWHQRMKSRPSITPSTANKNTIDLKVTYNEFNISRFATPMICSELITRYMLIPDNDRMKLISPDVFLSLEVNREDDSLRARVEVGQDMSNKVLHYTLGLLRKVGITLSKSKCVGLDILCDYGGKFVSIIGENLPTQDSYENKNVDYDIEQPEIRFDPSEITTGSSLLLSCDVSSLESIINRTAPDALVQTYYVKRLSLNPACAMLQDSPGTRQTSSRLLYRLILMKKGYTIRQFVGDGNWTDKQRLAICTALGIPVGETYTKLENCWRLNWADVLVLVIGVIIVVVILVACEVAGVDLETYGVAGIATLPFILALLNRVRLSYSHNPQYSQLPSLNPE